MSPVDRTRLPLHWKFEPLRDPHDGSVRWLWKAHDHAGAPVMESERAFESLTDCVSDARWYGFEDPH
jgi:hypothetical protein